MNWTKVAEDSIAILGAIVAALVPIMPILIPIISARIKDERIKRAIDSVGMAAFMGVAAGLRAANTKLAMARVPGSLGGTEVTREELSEAISEGCVASKQWLKDNGYWDKALATYGSEQALGDAVSAVVSHRLSRHEMVTVK